ncbi:flagellar FlbD family protein [Bacillus sp. 2205SS5-2]|uniref:flagellar FlbD family protein n=1 Tax=Bacillus sp. 2205SS5-2 TaxID=3109031 RepID=UPI003006C7D0
MIHVTRLNGSTFWLNAVYFETIEILPDTTITLTNGKKYVVKENEKDIVNKIFEFYERVNLLGTERVKDKDET